MRGAIFIGIGGLMLAAAALAQPGGQPSGKPAGQAVAPAGPALPGWLAGCWIEQKGTAWAEECWTTARGGVMIGSGRTGVGDRVKSWEAIQILAEGPDLALYAAPGGKDRTRFLAEAGPQAGGAGVTFVNTANDYPQRIRYWREGDLLLAEIALADGSQARRWTFKRM